MSPAPITERWPPVYDAEDLASTIEKLVQSRRIVDIFYEASSQKNDERYQGDIVRIPSGIPLLDEDGQACVVGSYDYWLIIGNTCDIARDLKDVEWSQIVPLQYVGSDNDLSADKIQALSAYTHSRRFYIPPWNDSVKGLHHVADFLRPVTVHKRALKNIATLEVRLNRYSWMLLHACLVRFLARDDGRFA